MTQLLQDMRRVRLSILGNSHSPKSDWCLTPPGPSFGNLPANKVVTALDHLLESAGQRRTTIASTIQIAAPITSVIGEPGFQRPRPDAGQLVR
jgi:hypothetical protein